MVLLLKKTITAKFVNKTILGICNDVLSLAIYGKLNLDKKIESNLNIDKLSITIGRNLFFK